MQIEIINSNNIFEFGIEILLHLQVCTIITVWVRLSVQFAFQHFHLTLINLRSPRAVHITVSWFYVTLQFDPKILALDSVFFTNTWNRIKLKHCDEKN